MIHCVQQKSTAQVSLGKFEKNSNGGLYMPTTQQKKSALSKTLTPLCAADRTHIHFPRYASNQAFIKTLPLSSMNRDLKT